VTLTEEHDEVPNGCDVHNIPVLAATITPEGQAVVSAMLAAGRATASGIVLDIPDADALIDPSSLKWDTISDAVWRRYCMTDEIDNRPFPRSQTCEGCGGEYIQKRHDHKHCKEACRWKDVIRKNGPAAERARKRFRDWYLLHKAEHIANVTRRKRERGAASLSLPTPSSDTASASTEASATIELSGKSSRCASEPTTSKTTTVEPSTGEGLSQCG
jgi:hypothetical protein